MHMSSVNALKDVRILVVDDDADLVDSVATTLMFLGCTVSTAMSLDAARHTLRHQPPDIVICDWNLAGERSDGFLRELQQRCPHIGRILLTGSARTEWGALLEEGVVQRVLAKPFELHELSSALLLARQPLPPMLGISCSICRRN
jgi:DNA-binding NtrC family response regulator